MPDFLRAKRDGAVLPILHLNGYKISGPTTLGRADDERVSQLLRSHGWDPIVVAGDKPDRVFPDLYDALSRSLDRIPEVQTEARSTAGGALRPGWPAIVLRTPEGMDRAARSGWRAVEGTFRAHQVPLANVRENPEHLAILDRWMRSYRPEELFDECGRLIPELAALAPAGDKRMSACPYAQRRAVDPRVADPRSRVVRPAAAQPGLGLPRDDSAVRRADARHLQSDDDRRRRRHLPVVLPGRNREQPPAGGVRGHRPVPAGTGASRRTITSLRTAGSWRCCPSISAKGGSKATYSPAGTECSRPTRRSRWWPPRCSSSTPNGCNTRVELPWRAPVASLNVLLTSTCWRNDHNGFSHQGPGLIDSMIPLAPDVVRVWLPPDANCTLSIADHCLRSHDHVNLIVVDKQEHLQYLNLDEANAHCAAGASVWDWAGTELASPGAPDEPDIVLAAAGDVPTMEILAAAQLLREHTPYLRVRVVNIVDLMALLPRDDHPHGFSDDRFAELFTHDTDVVFAFHGYPRAVHQLLHGRENPARFHVRGFIRARHDDDTVRHGRPESDESISPGAGSVAEVPPGRGDQGRSSPGCAQSMLERHHTYVREHLEDMPEVRDWTWSGE